MPSKAFKVVTEVNLNEQKCVRCGKKLKEISLAMFGGAGLCIDCSIESHTRTSVLEYNLKPANTFCLMEKERIKNIDSLDKQLYLGIELEIEHKNKDLQLYATELQRLFPVYIKHDGSLNHGFELVSHPSTLTFHQKVINWYTILRKLREDKCTSFDNTRCGLHVHMNRKYFKSDKHLYNMIMFFYKCFDKLMIFSRRKNSEFCAKWNSDLIKYINHKTKCNQPISGHQRHSCINLTNKETIEIRIYRGTLNYDRFLASLLFTDAIAKFAGTTSAVFFANKEIGRAHV